MFTEETTSPNFDASTAMSWNILVWNAPNQENL